MDYVSVKRQTVAIAFSKAFEALLLNYPTEHRSLSHDLELAIKRGLSLFDGLERTADLQHKYPLEVYIALTDRHNKTESNYFKTWHIAISEAILADINALETRHGKALAELGIDLTTGNLAVFLALIGTVK